MSDFFQWAVIAFVVLSILYHVWKGGAANPVGTGKIERIVNGLKQEVVALTAAEKTAARASDLKRLELEMESRDKRVEDLFDCLRKIERDAAARHATMDEVAGDVRQMSGELDVLQKDVGGLLSTTRTTAEQVGRLYDVIVPKGMQ